MLYEMLTGTAAFGGKAGLVRRFSTPPKVSAKRAVPEHIDAAVAKAMAREPEERFHTAREFGRALAA